MIKITDISYIKRFIVHFKGFKAITLYDKFGNNSNSLIFDKENIFINEIKFGECSEQNILNGIRKSINEILEN